ncbi:uncharacterized protein LOC131433949 [Malaya genurostris]|uniref:uncharacterized protein LOC131433949 n=1 Tax=Malaya genurostris TaxID=325434 RepID=UPI0026F3D302|nr:uncharacterized protein LOC131433949 [Malaya genurostris]
MQPALTSRPGPVCASGEEVFQPAAVGKYTNNVDNSCTDCFPVSSSNSFTLARSSHIQLYYQNVGGMNTCLDDYLLSSSDECFDIIALTETWLSESTLSLQAFGANYDVFRCDRDSRNSSKKSGGGVLAAIHRRLKAQLITNVSGSSVEQVWVQICLNTCSFFLCVVYFPPDRTRDLSLIDSHIQTLEKVVSVHMKPADDILIVGDFNFPGLKWYPASNGFMFADPMNSSFHTGIVHLLDRYSLNLLRQVNHVENEHNRILDLCFSSKSDFAPRISEAAIPIVKSVRYHPPLHIVLESNQTLDNCKVPQTVRYNFKRADYNSIVAFLSNVDWTEILDNDDINFAAQTFSNVLIYAIDQYVPKQISQLSKQAPWQSAELRKLKSLKRTALRKYSKKGGFLLRQNYLEINKVYKKTAKRCYANYLRSVQRKLKSNPKSFWKHVNEQRKEPDLPSSMYYNDQPTSSLQEICDMFMKKFSGVFSRDFLSTDQISQAARNVPVLSQSLNFINVDISSVQKAIVKMKSSYSPGPDGIPAVVLKKCSSGIATPLCQLFQQSLTTGVFPVVWKSSYMFPVHKKGDRKNIDNYRGITLLSAIPKLFELVVLEPIFNHCKHCRSTGEWFTLPHPAAAPPSSASTRRVVQRTGLLGSARNALIAVELGVVCIVSYCTSSYLSLSSLSSRRKAMSVSPYFWCRRRMAVRWCSSTNLTTGFDSLGSPGVLVLCSYATVAQLPHLDCIVLRISYGCLAERGFGMDRPELQQKLPLPTVNGDEPWLFMWQMHA